jgi:hypothetical protein
MEDIFNDAKATLPWLKIASMRKFIQDHCRSAVAKAATKTRLETQLTSIDGDVTPDKVTKMVALFAKHSFFGSSPEEASDQLKFCKDSEKRRLRQAIASVTQEASTQYVTFRQNLETTLASAGVVLEKRPSHFLQSPDDTTRKVWVKMIQEIKGGIQMQFTLNTLKSDAKKQQKTEALAAKRARDDEPVVLTRKQFEMLNSKRRSDFHVKATKKASFRVPHQNTAPKRKSTVKKTKSKNRTAGKKRI